MLNKLLVLLTVLLLIPTVASAQNGEPNPTIIYNGVQMQQSELLIGRTAPLTVRSLLMIRW